jgi:hypothetical protein
LLSKEASTLASGNSSFTAVQRVSPSMKRSAIERLARKHLLPKLPEFAARRSLVYRRPLDAFLRGLSFDTSGFASGRIFVTAFVQPLFVPSDSLFYTFGFRLGDDFWDVEEQDPDPTFAAIADAAQDEALPFFEELADLDRFCERVPEWATTEPKKLKSLQSLDDPVVTEALGYAELLRGRKDEGVRLLEKTIESERENGEYANDELIAHAEQVLDAVNRLGLEAGQAQLEEWRAETIRNLRLEE